MEGPSKIKYKGSPVKVVRVMGVAKMAKQKETPQSVSNTKEKSQPVDAYKEEDP